MRMRVKILPQWGYWRDSVFYGTCVPHIWPSLQLKVISPRGPIFASYFFRLKAKRSKTDTVLLPFRFAKLINQFFASFRFKFFSSCRFTFLSINFLLQFVLLRVQKKLNFKPILGIFCSCHFVSHAKKSVSLQSEAIKTNLLFRYFALLISASVSLWSEMRGYTNLTLPNEMGYYNFVCEYDLMKYLLFCTLAFQSSSLCNFFKFSIFAWNKFYNFSS